jgi:hypothetical protein
VEKTYFELIKEVNQGREEDGQNRGSEEREGEDGRKEEEKLTLS